MNNDLLSGLLTGNGNMLAALLPLISGVKKGEAGTPDLASLLAVLNAVKGGSSQGTLKGGSTPSFPPLFGGASEEKTSATEPLSMLRSLLNVSSKDISAATPTSPTYPYELQYNRPEGTK